MKKALPYILGAVLIAGILLMVFTGKNGSKPKKFDDRVTLRTSDKIPYGTYIARTEIAKLFPGATIYNDRHAPGFWDSLSGYEPDQAVIIISEHFAASESEMERLVGFVERGNDVFISARNISYSVGETLGCRVITESGEYFDGTDPRGDTLKISISDRNGTMQHTFTYPGKAMDAFFTTYDKEKAGVLGTDKLNRPNFIRMQAGRGNLFLQLAPLAFSNYFLLQRQNINYYERALSLIDPGTRKIIWDEFYVNRKTGYENPDEKQGKNWFTVMMNAENANGQRSFRAAFWLLMGLMVLFILQEMRRKQRMIPVVKPPRNDSMDFARTIGRLYYDKADHRNLARKTSAYFLEYVRHKYKLLTGMLDDHFIKTLHFKSGVAEEEVSAIVQFIHFSENSDKVSEKQLVDFHDRLEAFYKKT